MNILLAVLIYCNYVIFSLMILYVAVYVKSLRKVALIIGILSIGNYMTYASIGGKNILKTMKELYNE